MPDFGDDDFSGMAVPPLSGADAAIGMGDAQRAASVGVPTPNVYHESPQHMDQFGQPAPDQRPGWQDSYTAQQHAYIAELNNKKQAIQQAVNSGQIRPQEAQRFNEQIDSQLLGVQPMRIPKQPPPNIKQEHQQRVFTDPSTGMTHTLQPDGSIDTQPPAPHSPWALDAQAHHAIDQENVKAQSKMQEAEDKHYIAAQDKEWKAMQDKVKDATKNQADLRKENEKQAVEQRKQFEKEYKDTEAKLNKDSIAKANAATVAGKEAPVPKVAEHDEVIAAMKDHRGKMDQSYAEMHPKAQGNHSGSMYGQGGFYGDDSEARLAAQPQSGAGAANIPPEQKHPDLRDDAPPQAHQAALALEGIVKQYGRDPSQWPIPVRAQAKAYQDIAKQYRRK